MMKNIKKIALLCTAFGSLCPIVSIKISNYNISLGLINLGFLSIMASLILILLSLHSFYLNESLERKFSIYFNVVSLLFSIYLFFRTYSELNKLKESLGFFSKITSSNFSYSWGWILIFAGLVIALVCNIIILKTSKEVVIEDTAETLNDEDISL